MGQYLLPCEARHDWAPAERSGTHWCTTFPNPLAGSRPLGKPRLPQERSGRGAGGPGRRPSVPRVGNRDRERIADGTQKL